MRSFTLGYVMSNIFVAPVAALFVLVVGVPAQAEAVVGYGAFTPLPQAGEQPNPQREYRVIVDLTQGGPDDKPLKGLERVARLTNMLAANGVTAEKRSIVVVMHGGASLASLSDAAWSARNKGATNPNSALIRALTTAGVQVRLCGQSMVAHGLTEADLAPGVQVDLAALMTVIHHQQAGYALIMN